ncbi:MAG: ATP-binding cassette domain-containing protein [Elusimicrobiota bacterium]|nr:ATP-binding cassette domain-containing protein [Elusimicrobiota bacterium]
MIEIKNLTFRYKDGTTALKNLSAVFPQEKNFGILGQSGSGKTTLLNCIARFLTPQQGGILLDGQDIFTMNEIEFRRKIGVIFQGLYLFPHLTVLENMTLAPCKSRGIDYAQVRAQAEEMLTRLDINDLAGSYPAQISGGQAQRVAIARGLMLQPEYMLLDEPTSALDVETTEDFARWLGELHENTNFIIVTHDLLFARQVLKRAIYMRNGEITHSGYLRDILPALDYEKNKNQSE